MNNTLKVLALGVAVAASATMAKADTISWDISVNGSSIGSGGGTGILSVGPVSGSGYTVSIAGLIPPASTPPNFSTNTTTISMASGAGAATVVISITDTGLTAGPGPVQNTFTNNALGATSFKSDSISNYVDFSDTPFGMGQLLATSKLFTLKGNDSSGPFNSFIGGGTYSETTIYTLMFNANTSGQAQSVAASSQIASTTPEPGSLALLGTGLLGMAGVARRKLFRK